jgi:two-component system, NarL family, response regulator DevR
MRIAILVVEDDPPVAAALSRTLARHGEVHLAANLEEAFRRLEEISTIACAVVDWGLPDGSGGELLTRLHERGIPSMVVTGMLEHDVVNAAQTLGAEIAIKPVSEDNLDAFLERVLTRARALDTALDGYVVECGLTPRHRQILERASGGISRRDLAVDLGVAEATLKAHVRTMRKRTQADSLAAMVQDVLVRALNNGRG